MKMILSPTYVTSRDTEVSKVPAQQSQLFVSQDLILMCPGIIDMQLVCSNSTIGIRTGTSRTKVLSEQFVKYTSISRSIANNVVKVSRY
jgi:hypothetical protein